MDGISFPEVDHLALYTEDAQEAYERLAARGVEFDKPPHTTALGHRNMQRTLVNFKDPGGYSLQLSQTVDPRPHLEQRRQAKAAMAAGGGLLGGFDHVSTYCSDMGATRAFYRDILGLEEFFYSASREEGAAVGDGFEQAAYAVGGTDIEVATAGDKLVGRGAVRQIGFSTGDIDKTYAAVLQKGARPQEVKNASKRVFSLHSPDGLAVQIMQERD